MGSVFKKQTTRGLPAGAEVVAKGGKSVARWRVKGKLRTTPLSAHGTRIVTDSATYYAKFRGHDGVVVTRPTGCRDRQAAEQHLAKWEREVEQIKAGTLDPAALAVAKHTSTPLADHFDAYDLSLVTAGTTEGHRANVRRFLNRVGLPYLCPIRFHQGKGGVLVRGPDQ